MFLNILWRKSKKLPTAYFIKSTIINTVDDKSLIHIAGMVHYVSSNVHCCILQLLLKECFSISFDNILKSEYCRVWSQAWNSLMFSLSYTHWPIYKKITVDFSRSQHFSFWMVEEPYFKVMKISIAIIFEISILNKNGIFISSAIFQLRQFLLLFQTNR